MYVTECTAYIADIIIQLLKLGLFTRSKLSNNIVHFNYKKQKLFYSDTFHIDMITYYDTGTFKVNYSGTLKLSELNNSDVHNYDKEIIITKDNCALFDKLLNTFKSAKIFRDIIRDKLREFLVTPLEFTYSNKYILIEPKNKPTSIDNLDVYSILYIRLENFKAQLYYKDYSNYTCANRISMYSLNYSKLMCSETLISILNKYSFT